MLITRRQLRRIIAEEVSRLSEQQEQPAGIPAIEVHRRLNSVAVWLLGIDSDPSRQQMGAGEIILNVILPLARGDMTYDKAQDWMTGGWFDSIKRTYSDDEG
jgi:hypothetical protein